MTDDEDLVGEVADALRLEGYKVAAFTDSIEAWQQVIDIMPDLALLDLRMSGHSGFELANRISHRPETSHIPVIAMTGHYDEDKYKGLMQIVGIREYLKKPFSPKDLLRLLEKLLGTAGHTGRRDD
jgi:DNA-binding response OmpR family regulator